MHLVQHKRKTLRRGGLNKRMEKHPLSEYNGKKEYTFVWLRHDILHSHMFFCPTCQTPILRYQGSVVMMSPGTPEDVPMLFPIEIYCKNKNGSCPQVFIFEGMVM